VLPSKEGGKIRLGSALKALAKNGFAAQIATGCSALGKDPTTEFPNETGRFRLSLEAGIHAA
jgi:hypothetical protein